MVVDKAHMLRIGTKSVRSASFVSGSKNKGQAGGVDWKGTGKWGVQALGVDRKVRGKLMGWTGNEPENRGV